MRGIVASMIRRVVFWLMRERLGRLYRDWLEMADRQQVIRINLNFLMADLVIMLGGGLAELRWLIGERAVYTWQQVTGEETG